MLIAPYGSLVQTMGDVIICHRFLILYGTSSAPEYNARQNVKVTRSE